MSTQETNLAVANAADKGFMPALKQFCRMDGVLSLCNLRPETGEEGTAELIAITVFGRGNYVYVTDRNAVYLVTSNVVENVTLCNFLCRLQGSYCSMALYSNGATTPCVLVGTTRGLYAYPLLSKQVYSSLTAEAGHVIAHVETVSSLIIYSREIKDQGNTNSTLPFLCPGKNNLKASLKLKLAEKNNFTPHAQENQYMSSSQERKSQRGAPEPSTKHYELVISRWDTGNRLRYLAIIDDCIVSNGQFTAHEQDGVLIITAFALNTGSPVIYSYSEADKLIKNYPPSYDTERLMACSFNSIGATSQIVSAMDLIYVSCNHSLYVCNVCTEKLVQIPCENILQMTLTPSNNVLIMVNRGLYLACYNYSTESITIHKLYDFAASIKPNRIAINGPFIMCCGCLVKGSSDGRRVNTCIPVTMSLAGSD